MFWRCVIAVVSGDAQSACTTLRDNVLLIVNDNSVDSPQLGAIMRSSADINPANIVHVNVVDSYFISCDECRRLRDQLIRFMQSNMLDDLLLTSVVYEQ